MTKSFDIARSFQEARQDVHIVRKNKGKLSRKERENMLKQEIEMVRVLVAHIVVPLEPTVSLTSEELI